MGRLRRRTGNPGFLIAALGGSIGALGTTGAFVLWTISVSLGALQNNIHAELATMFPQQVRRHLAVRARGVAQVPHADRPAGDVRLLVRLVERARDQRLRGRHADPGRVVLGHHLDPGRGRLRLSLPICDRHRPASSLVWLFNIFGVRPAVWFGYVTGGAADPPRGRADVPAVPHRRLVERQHDVEHRHRRRPRARADLALLHGLVGVRDRDRGGVRARVPRHRARHAAGAARLGRCSPCVVYALLPLGIGGTLGTAGDRRRRDRHRVLQRRLRHARRQRARQRDDRLPGRGADAVDEHRDDGRLAGAVRHRARTG